MGFSPNASGSISGANDASVNSPSNGQVLSYNSSIGKWQNTTITNSGGITGVNITKIVVSDNYPSGLNAGDFWFRPYAASGPAIPYPAGTYFTDDFNRADGELGIAAHGEQYVSSGTPGAGIQISSQIAVPPSSTGVGVYVSIGITNLPQTRAIAANILNFNSTSAIGLLFGYASGGNYLQAQLNSNAQIRLLTDVAGTITTSTGPTVTMTANSVFKVTLTLNSDSSGTMKMYVDGILKYTPPTISASNMSTLVGNNVGFFMQRTTSADSSALDNIIITDS